MARLAEASTRAGDLPKRTLLATNKYLLDDNGTCRGEIMDNLRLQPDRNDLLPFVMLVCMVAGACAEDAAPGVELAAEPLEQALPTNAKIETVTASGSGCPEGTWRINLSDERESFEVVFTEFELEADERRMSQEATCRITLKLAGEEGVSYAPVTAAVVSEVDVDPRANATIATKVQWSGASGSSQTLTRINGPEDSTINSGGIGERLWSGCTGARELSIDVTAAVRATRERSRTQESRVDVQQAGRLSFTSRRCATPPVDPPAPAPEQAVIAGVRTVGAGCPSDTATAAITQDGKDLSVNFQAFSLSVDETKRIDRKLCSVIVDVDTPPGYTFALEGLKGAGRVVLAEGMEAQMTRSVSFTGLGTIGGTKTTNLVGPQRSEFRIDDSFTGSDLGFMPCGARRSMHVDLGLTLINGTPAAKGELILSNVGEVRLALRKCGEE